jgi:aspartyl-tRNA(Asn)/glutamyl-tRNA(Gln) amidotransferase subunit A
LLSTAGVLALAPSMDHVGLITRSVRDSALMLSCLVTGPPGERSASLCPGASLTLNGIRAGIDRRQLAQQSHDPEVWAAFEAALEVLQSLGLVLSDIDLPDGGKTVTAANTVIGFEAHLQFQGVLRDSPDRLGAGLHSKLRAAASIGVDDYHLARVFARAAREQVDAVLLSGVDVIVSPGREAPAERLDALMANPTAQRSACNRLYSLTGHPALTLPMGLSRAGLPLAIQLASAHHGEALILQVGAAFEDTLGWHTDAQNCTVNPPWARAVPG